MGLGSPTKKATVKEVIRNSKTDIVLLQETKLNSMSILPLKTSVGVLLFIGFVEMLWVLQREFWCVVTEGCSS